MAANNPDSKEPPFAALPEEICIGVIEELDTSLLPCLRSKKRKAIGDLSPAFRKVPRLENNIEIESLLR